MQENNLGSRTCSRPRNSVDGAVLQVALLMAVNCSRAVQRLEELRVPLVSKSRGDTETVPRASPKISPLFRCNVSAFRKVYNLIVQRAQT